MLVFFFLVKIPLPPLARALRMLFAMPSPYACVQIISRILEIDPDYTVTAYADMMRKQIAMPAHLMYDGENPNIWNDFSSIAEDLGVYTAMDYAEIIEHLNKRWDIEHIKLVDGEAAKDQVLACTLIRHSPTAHTQSPRASTSIALKDIRVVVYVDACLLFRSI